MTEMRLQLQARAREALASLRHAQDTDDSYLATVRIAELEGLRRLAHEHGLRIPELSTLPAA
jgi:hypothetical protein